MRLLLLIVMLFVAVFAYAPGIGYEQLSNDVYRNLNDYYKSAEHIRILPFLKRRLPFPLRSLNPRLLAQFGDMKRINYW